jgi:hypothetical protein
MNDLFIIAAIAGWVIGLVSFTTLMSERAVHALIVKTIEDERDTARKEATVYRAMILPGYERVASAGPVTYQQVGQQPVASLKPNATENRASARRPRGISSRQWFNLLRAKTNSKQQHIDKIAEAILEKKAKVSPQGENHV